MDEDNEVGGLARKNHAKWKKTLTSQGFMIDYIDNFVQQPQQLLDEKWLIAGDLAWLKRNIVAEKYVSEVEMLQWRISTIFQKNIL